MPTNLEDYSEIMSKQWARETFNSLEDVDPNNDLFLPDPTKHVWQQNWHQRQPMVPA